GVRHRLPHRRRRLADPAVTPAPAPLRGRRSIPRKVGEGKALDTPRPQPRHAPQLRQVDDKTATVKHTAALLDELDGAEGRAPGGDQVVHQQYPLPGLDGVHMDFDAVDAVFQAVLGGQGATWQLALLADRHEALAEGKGKGRAEDEAPRL